MLEHIASAPWPRQHAPTHRVVGGGLGLVQEGKGLLRDQLRALAQVEARVPGQVDRRAVHRAGGGDGRGVVATGLGRHGNELARWPAMPKGLVHQARGGRRPEAGRGHAQGLEEALGQELLVGHAGGSLQHGTGDGEAGVGVFEGGAWLVDGLAGDGGLDELQARLRGRALEGPELGPQHRVDVARHTAAVCQQFVQAHIAEARGHLHGIEGIANGGGPADLPGLHEHRGQACGHGLCARADVVLVAPGHGVRGADLADAGRARCHKLAVCDDGHGQGRQVRALEQLGQGRGDVHT